VSSAGWSDTQVRSGTSYCRRIYNALPLGFALMHASSLGKAALVFAVSVALVHEGRVDLTGSMMAGCPGSRAGGTRVQSDTGTKGSAASSPYPVKAPNFMCQAMGRPMEKEGG